ncbi:LPS-assembly lipoprotein [Franzmannia pantelleriensis]|uniref:LPS-assembly lipoprotein LptE n=1 Tax=Franzmannia pantelleriensis TaxID=48727 RepID=A0A1G9V5G1_9GAMM|nr:LPS assembly lipoprotein LptE [Halomonas pantelleriensis]SDM67363.1 LPS-assembly lipoprotein [Halomonas pantelleriensis]
MQRRRFLHLSLAAGAGLALAGCGFHLRGLDTPVMSLDSIALVAADSDLTPAVQAALERAGTAIRDDAPLRLNLGDESFRESRRTFGSAASREIEMTLRAPFSVQRQRDNAYLLNQQQLEVSTNFSISDDNLLAQEDLREEARQELREEAARRLLDRLRALDSQPGSLEATDV